MSSGESSKYLKYAVGEIILVVLGILIALQINNANENRKTRKLERSYLENIRTDLQQNLVTLDAFIINRKSSIASSEKVLAFINKINPLDIDEFCFHTANVLVWYPFEQHDNTYQELLNSGKFSIISNKAIKDSLQNIQTSFKRIAFVENEMQQDFESYLYNPYFTTADMQTTIVNYEEQLSNRAISQSLDPVQVEVLLNNMAFKNGFVLSNFNSKDLIREYTKMISTTQELIGMIDVELEE